MREYDEYDEIYGIGRDSSEITCESGGEPENPASWPQNDIPELFADQPPDHGYSAPNESRRDEVQARHYTYRFENDEQEQEVQEWDFADYTKPGNRKKHNSKLVLAVASALCTVAVGLSFFSALSLYYYVSEGRQPAEHAVEQQNPGRQESDLSYRDDDAGSFDIAPPPGDTSGIVREDGMLTTAQVAEKVTPAVVGVVIYENAARLTQPSGSGSGIVMTEDGYIITNAHVVEDAEFIRVLMSDETSYDAEIVGIDVRTDLAVIKVEAEGLPVAVFGDSDALRVGDTVIAIGNPTGMLSGTVTQGIVSALNREMDGSNRYAMPLIQTDAAINRGNSGGALVNIFGQVVGIPSSKIMALGFEGIGFAIPITDAKPIINDLVRHGRVTGRVMLGISGEVVDERASNANNIPMGIQIVWINPDTDIYRRDVQPGDIITHVDGDRVHTFDEVWEALDEHEAGDVVTITIFRQNGFPENFIDIEVILQEDLG